ncbi:MAG: DMT family transporter [Thermodesulfobacteriota bacterium]|nr:DMT family transporter [Thermodesulfobacteriota bacterium]
MLNQQALWGYLFAIGATAIWSGNFIIARGLSESISPISLAFWRWVVAVVVFLPFAIKPLIAEWEILKRNLPYLSITALLGVTTFNTLIYLAGQTTTAINLSLISITFPIFIIILSRFFYGEAITVNKGIGILLVAAGVILLITEGAPSILLNLTFAIGDVWMLMAAIIFAIYSLLLKRRPEKLSIWTLQLSTFILGLIFLLPFYIWDSATVSPLEFDTKTVFAIFYVGIFASLSAFVLWNKAIVAVGPTKAGMVYYTLPLFSGTLAYLFLKEDIGMLHFYCALLIISGILTANYESN